MDPKRRSGNVLSLEEDKRWPPGGDDSLARYPLWWTGYEDNLNILEHMTPLNDPIMTDDVEAPSFQPHMFKRDKDGRLDKKATKSAGEPVTIPDGSYTYLCQDTPIKFNSGSAILTAFYFRHGQGDFYVTFRLVMRFPTDNVKHIIACTDQVGQHNVNLDHVRGLILQCPWFRHELGLVSV